MKKPMKLNLETWGQIKLVADEPLILSNMRFAPERLVEQCDDGRLFVTTTADDQRDGVVTAVSLQSIGADYRREDQCELEWLANPVKCNPTTGKTTIYLGRFHVVETDSIEISGQTQFLTELLPYVLVPLDWCNTTCAEEMMMLARRAGVDERKLRQAGLDCAELAAHLFNSQPASIAAFERVQAWCRGEVMAEEMQAAVKSNDAKVLEIGAKQSFNNHALEYACSAASVNPKDVVENVVRALVNSATDPDSPIYFQTQDAIRHAIRPICANLIRGVIKVEDHPELVKVIEARNQALCRMPCLDLATLATLFAPRPNPVATTSLPPPKPLELAEVELAGRG